MSDKKSTFQPVHPFDFENPRSWAQTVGEMDWDTTHICFTKRSLLDFLKNVGVTVGTNYSEVSKLPKYATFGKFSKEATNAAVKDLIEAEIADPAHNAASNSGKDGENNNAAGDFRPSRKVTQRPGGNSSISFFEGEYEHTDALSLAPPRPKREVEDETAASSTEKQSEGKDAGEKQEGEGEGDGELTHTERMRFEGVTMNDDSNESNNSNNAAGSTGFRPSRKVRDAPGGKSSMKEILGGW